jgi:hypothetical protein
MLLVVFPESPESAPGQIKEKKAACQVQDISHQVGYAGEDQENDRDDGNIADNINAG